MAKSILDGVSIYQNWGEDGYECDLDHKPIDVDTAPTVVVEVTNPDSLTVEQKNAARAKQVERDAFADQARAAAKKHGLLMEERLMGAITFGEAPANPAVVKSWSGEFDAGVRADADDDTLTIAKLHEAWKRVYGDSKPPSCISASDYKEWSLDHGADVADKEKPYQYFATFKVAFCAADEGVLNSEDLGIADMLNARPEQERREYDIGSHGSQNTPGTARLLSSEEIEIGGHASSQYYHRFALSIGEIAELITNNPVEKIGTLWIKGREYELIDAEIELPERVQAGSMRDPREGHVDASLGELTSSEERTKALEAATDDAALTIERVFANRQRRD